jgi:hypothetical protein
MSHVPSNQKQVASICLASELLLAACMRLNEATKLIQVYAEAMNSRYGRIVFDEWAIICFVGSKSFVLAYHGPREKGFRINFPLDAGSLWGRLQAQRQCPGDFEFSHDGEGTRFESFTVLGEGVYLIWNNTAQSIREIVKNPLWFGAQVPFVELSDKLRVDPMVRPSRQELFFVSA